MPLWSVQEWRARIGTSWCALGRPIRSKSSYRSRGNYLGSPPPGGGGGGGSGRRRGAESCAHHGAVTVVIMIALLVGTIVTLLHFVLGGHRLIDACWFVCTPMDLLLVQWMLAMSLVMNGVSQFFSESWSLLCCSDSIGSFLSGFEAFPNSRGIYRVAILFDIRIMEKSKRTDEQVARGSMLKNFWQTFYGKMKSIRLSLISAVVKASLLLRCGDVETNPGPDGKLNQVIDSEHGGVPRHLGQIADAMSEWEGPITEQLELTRVDVAAIKTRHPGSLELQIREALHLWRQRLGSAATYRNLILVFEHAGYENLAEVVKQLISDSEEDNEVQMLTEKDILSLLQQLAEYADRWRDIGTHLGFRPGELDNIQVTPLLMATAPTSWLRAMLSQWLQWAPGDYRGSTNFATLEGLKDAVRRAGLGATAEGLTLQGIQTVDRYFLIGEKLIMETSESGRTYRWLKDDNPIMNGQEYDGVNTPKLTIKNASSTSAGTYTCRVDGNVVNQFHQILTTSEEMKRAFQEYGSVTLNIAKILVTGGAGSGKTCTKAILYGRVPPTKHISTDLLEGEKPTYCEKLYLPTGEEFEKWTPAELKDILVMLRNGIMSKAKPKRRRQHSVVMNEDHADHADHDDANDQLVLDVGPTGSMLLQEIKEQGFGGRNLAEFYWVYFFDSAGQSEYLDIIPAFIQNVTVTMYVLDLTKPLHLNLQDNYGIEGEPGPVENKKFTVKGEQFLQMVLQTLQFQSKEKISKLMVVGTHRDKCDDQDVKQRNEEVHKIVDRIKRETQNFDVVSHGAYDKKDIIFELSAIKDPTPDQDEHTQRTATEIRRKVSTECSQNKPSKIPIMWFLCEEDLRKKGDILTFDECKPIAEQNKMKEEDLKKMLKHFHKLNLLFYYPEDDNLINIVFTNPLIVMKIVSDIVKDARKDLIPRTIRKTICKHHIDEVIERHSEKVEELIKLLEKRLILVKFPERDEYYMPCIFSVCENPSEAIEKKCHPNQANKHKLHTTFLIELDNGCAPRGIFYGLICYFLGHRDAEIELIHDSSDPGLYRNFIHGNYKQNSSFQVSLVNSFHYFEVHIIGPRYDKDVCEKIRKYLKNGLQAAYKQFYREQDVPMPVRFPCPATKNCHNSPHMAEFPEVGTPRRLICSQDKEATYKLDSKHLVWLNEEERKHAYCNTPAIEPKEDDPMKDLNVNRGGVVKLSVKCNDADLKYQWQHETDGDSTDVRNSPHYKVDKLNLTIRNAQEKHAGYYQCIVTNLAGCSVSGYFHVIVLQVPSAPPSDLIITRKDSSSVSLSCKPPPKENHNGQLIGYTVEVQDVNGVPQQASKQSANNFITIDGLNSDTEYVFQVSARTAAGSGPTTTVSGRTTKGDGGGGSADSPPTLPTMLRILQPVSSQWMNIGIMLSLSHERLTAIETLRRGVPDDCLREMLNDWLQQTNPPPTKSALVSAVEMYNPLLAEKISAL